jgi:hypothetical protein
MTRQTNANGGVRCAKSWTFLSLGTPVPGAPELRFLYKLGDKELIEMLSGRDHGIRGARPPRIKYQILREGD